ncbi:Mu transposase C-terminal domain-containing protein [Schinkia azotoformans]|uniref:Transposase n=1 Tax=Schinkia azotoformans LMG 9581 TaxID=1131731 RepID=K6DQB9_SCHAZ|nr:Mu transposase C-terminal domain-containing protein [Schinkia azotoformans]EKN70393.1 transposase [Schinkia azotoformans LMG 9581]MEC1640119.1 Mu transposase C-terminal domain-containing protein [Schinkia azotoformans]MEC1943557.1 Mu transposase C-terminal domain-containing protein [Schinkia azotoformans]
MLIVENNIIEIFDNEMNLDSLHRVLWISPNREDLVVVDIKDKKKMKYPFFRKYEEVITEIMDENARLIEFDPDMRLTSPDEVYLNKYKANRDANWNIIKDIVCKEPEIYISANRGKLVSEIKERTGKSKKVIYELLRKYWFYGKTKNGLLNNYFDCGAPGQERVYTKKTGPKPKNGNNYIITENDKKHFEKAIEQFHVKEKMDFETTYEHMCEKYYNSGFYRKHGVLVPIQSKETEKPTLRQFLYWYRKNYTLAERYKKRYGRRKATMDIRALQGNDLDRVKGVGYLFEIDSTPADIHLVSIDRKTILGPPTLYIVKDVFSRMIAGFHVTVSPPSYIEEAVALENAATNKAEFCSKYGLDIDEEEWPCHHLPQFLAGDRAELKSKKAENLVNLKVDVQNAPSYRGDLKPYVEQHFNKTNEEIRQLLSLAGAKQSQPKKRGDSDPERNAALTLYEFTQFMIIQIMTYNKSALPNDYFVTQEMFIDKVELSPIEVWNWGKKKILLHEEPRKAILYNLLPREKGKVTRRGIETNQMCYTSDVGVKQGWFEEKKIDGHENIEICFDPRNVSSIFVRLKNGELIQCYLTAKYKEYEGLHIEDVKAIMKYKKEQLEKKNIEEKQHKAELHAFSRKLAKDAKEETKSATKEMSFYERQKNKRETKKSDGRAIGSQNAFTAIDVPGSNEEPNQMAEIVSFPTKHPLTNNEISNIQKMFETKNKARRRNNESLE